jgi:hypothetical protein
MNSSCSKKKWYQLLSSLIIPAMLVLYSILQDTTPALALDRMDRICREFKSGTTCQRNRIVDNVPYAFDRLTHTGEWLGFHNNHLAPIRFGLNLTPIPGTDPFSWTKAHIQGIARSPRPGTPYIFVSSAGEVNSLLGESRGNLMVIEMGSRNNTGERLRSNRLRKSYETSTTASDTRDRVVKDVTIAGYNHPGSIQMVGDILAMGLEGKLDKNLPKGKVIFYNMADPLNPQKLVYELDTKYDDDNNESTPDKELTPGYLGITNLKNGRFLLITGEGHGNEMHFWLSNYNNLFKTGLKFEHFDVVKAEEIEPAGSWPVSTGKNYNNYQNFSLVNGRNGKIYMVPGRNRNPLAPSLPGPDVIALFQIELVRGKVKVSQVFSERTVNFKNDNSSLLEVNPIIDVFPVPYPFLLDLIYLPRLNADLLAGGGVYVSPSGELLFYAVEHYNWGPIYLPPVTYGPIVRMAELRHQEVARPDGPAYNLTARAGGPYTVKEGDAVELDGEKSLPSKVQPWVQLFEHFDFQGQSVMIDYPDIQKDDYDDFGKLDGQLLVDLCIDEELAALIEDPWILWDMYDGFVSLEPIDFLDTYTYSRDDCKGGCNSVYNKCAALCTYDPTGACKALCGLTRSGCYATCNLLPSGTYYIPDMNAYAWGVAEQFAEKMDKLWHVVNLYYNDPPLCGRLMSANLPAPPDFTLQSLLSLDHFSNFNPNNPFDFVKNTTNLDYLMDQAFNEFRQDAKDVLDYLGYIALSLKGFNDRASSVRWYAPSGLDITLYQKAGYGGGWLTLSGTGNVEEIDDLSYEQLVNVPGNADERIRSVKFTDTYNPPIIESYAWSILFAVPQDPYFLVDEFTSKATFDAFYGDGPAQAMVELVVGDSYGNYAGDSAGVTVVNVPPEVQIDWLKDHAGVSIDNGIPLLLEGLGYYLVGSFTDAGRPDTHTALVDWGDTISNLSSDPGFQFTDSTGGIMGAARVMHVYGAPGTYTMTFSVTDDDGGIGEAARVVEVVDAAGAIQLCIDRLLSLLGDPQLDRKSTKALQKIMSKLRGNQDGLAGNGALDHLADSRFNGALQMIEQALIEIFTAVNVEPSLTADLEPVQRTLALAAKSVVVQAVEGALLHARSRRDQGKIIEANEYIDQGDLYHRTLDFSSAVGYYLAAQRIVQGILK